MKCMKEGDVRFAEIELVYMLVSMGPSKLSVIFFNVCNKTLSV